DIQPRPAFERQLLDAIAWSIDNPRDARIERRPLQRAAEHLPYLLGHAPLALLDGLRRGDRVDLLLPPLPRFVSEAHEIPLEIVRVIGEHRILDAELDASGAGEMRDGWWLSRAATPCRGDDGCRGLEEAATRVLHVLAQCRRYYARPACLCRASSSHKTRSLYDSWRIIGPIRWRIISHGDNGCFTQGALPWMPCRAEIFSPVVHCC